MKILLLATIVFFGQCSFLYAQGSGYLKKKVIPAENKYVGEYKDEKKHGKGTETYSTGDKYVGKFKDGKRSGRGKYTWSDGRETIGEFKDDRPWNATEYDKNGNITARFRNGEQLGLSEEDKQNLANKDKSVLEGYLEGYKDIKFGMSLNQIKSLNVCNNFQINIFAPMQDSAKCYKIAGEIRRFFFKFQRDIEDDNPKDLGKILIYLKPFSNTFFNKISKSIGKKYKKDFALSLEKMFSLNEGNNLECFANGQISLEKKSDGISLSYNAISFLDYKDPALSGFASRCKDFAPKDVSSDDF